MQHALSFRSVYLNIPGLLIINVVVAMVGMVVYAYYAHVGCDPLAQGYISNANQVSNGHEQQTGSGNRRVMFRWADESHWPSVARSLVKCTDLLEGHLDVDDWTRLLFSAW